jgi:hypothetical protein
MPTGATPLSLPEFVRNDAATALATRTDAHYGARTEVQSQFECDVGENVTNSPEIGFW